MGKIIHLFFVTFFLVSSLYAQKRSAQDAITVASQFLKVSEDNLEAVSTQQSRSRGNKVSADKITRGYYVVNNDSGNCFVIVSADERMITVLGFSREGVFQEDKVPEGLLDLLDSYDVVYAQLAEGAQGECARRQVSYPDVSPLIKTEWGQGQAELPYNAQCPLDPAGSGKRCLTGCVATAMAQVMNYYKYPNQCSGEHSYTLNGFEEPQSINFSSVQFDWANMPSKELEWNGTNSSQINAVSQLMHVCGVAVEASYGVGGTSAIEGNIPYAFINYFGYNPNMQLLSRKYASTSEWHALIQQELRQQRPVIYSGQGYDGHQFILDGCNDNGYHVNWGWNGYCNGYFQLDAMEYSDQYNSFSYNDSQSMIIGISPYEMGKREDVFTSDGFYMTNKEVAVGETCYQAGVYSVSCYSSKTNSYYENPATIDATTCLALYDTEGTFIRELDSSVSRNYRNSSYWKTSPTFSFLVDAETFREGTKYHIVPCVRNDADNVYSPIYTMYGRSNYYIAETKNGIVRFSLVPAEQLLGATGSGTREDPYNVAGFLNMARNLYNVSSSVFARDVYVRGKVTDYIRWYEYSLYSEGDKDNTIYFKSCFYIDNTSWVEGDPEIKDEDELLICCSVSCPDGMAVSVSEAYVVLHNGAKTRGRGTQYNPYNVAEARERCQEYYDYAGNNNKFSYVRGYVVTIEEISTKFSNCSFHIADTKGATSDLLKVYRAYAPTTITSNDYLKVGDEVIVKGYLLTSDQRTVCVMRDKSQKTGCEIIEINPTTTAIRNIRDEEGPADARWYDLQGRHVLYPIKGRLYIRNGKKVIR